MPYGDLPPERIAQLVRSALSAYQSDRIVLACNTATAAAAEALRKSWKTPVFGIEPAIKSALAAERPYTVLCTPTTARLKGLCGPEVYTDARLAAEIESCVLNGESTAQIAKRISRVCRQDVVIGCTHYAYLTPHLIKLGHIIHDGAEGLLRNVARSMRNSGGASIQFCTQDPKRYRVVFDKELSVEYTV